MDRSINCGQVIASRKAAERLDFLIKDIGLHHAAAFEHFSAVDYFGCYGRDSDSDSDSSAQRWRRRGRANGRPRHSRAVLRLFWTQ